MAFDDREEGAEGRTRIPIRDKRKVRNGDEGAVIIENNPPEAQASGGEPAEDPALAEARAQAASHLDDLRRLKAEFDNYRKRTLKEQSRLIETASAEIVARLLGVMDNFAMAVSAAEGSRDFDSMFKGIQMVYSELRSVLEAAGLQVLGAQGQPFDPNLHEAVMQEEGDGSGNLVVDEVLRQGYLFKGAVLRPAMVRVTQDASGAAQAEA